MKTHHINQNISFQQLGAKEKMPYDLLLLADPSKKLVEAYLKKAEVFTATQKDEILGVVVLYPLSEKEVEIKNLAVQSEFQGQGIGSFLIENIIKVASAKNYQWIYIGTANSSINQLHLYHKLGFEITEVKVDFFTNNYEEPIYENGMLAKDMIILKRALG